MKEEGGAQKTVTLKKSQLPFLDSMTGRARRVMKRNNDSLSLSRLPQEGHCAF